MTNEEIDIAQIFNVPCKITVDGVEYSGIYRITQLIRFYNDKLKCFKFSAGVSNADYPHENYTIDPYNVRPVEGWDLFIAEKLKQSQKEEIYEKVKHKLMCRKEAG